MTRDGTVYVTLDQWVHLAAEVLGADAATIRRTADPNPIDSALHAPAAGFGEQDLYPDSELTGLVAPELVPAGAISGSISQVKGSNKRIRSGRGGTRTPDSLHVKQVL